VLRQITDLTGNNGKTPPLLARPPARAASTSAFSARIPTVFEHAIRHAGFIAMMSVSL